MSKMSNLHIEVIEMLEAGFVCTDIAKELDVPLIWVEDIMQDVYYDSEEYYEAEESALDRRWRVFHEAAVTGE